MRHNFLKDSAMLGHTWQTERVDVRRKYYRIRCSICGERIGVDHNGQIHSESNKYFPNRSVYRWRICNGNMMSIPKFALYYTKYKYDPFKDARSLILTCNERIIKDIIE
jgi:hypothetical protein